MDRSLDESIAERRRQVRLVLLRLFKYYLTDSSLRATATTATALQEIAVLLEMVSKRFVISSFAFVFQSYLHTA
jgi:hypothetical protein